MALLPDMLLFADNVSASRSNEEGQLVPVLKNITLGVAAGELLAIVGSSGSGKSTFLRLLNRLLEPDSGKIMLEGHDVRSFSPQDLRAKLSLVAQKPFLFPGTVKENLEAPARFRSMALPDFGAEKMRKTLAMCQIEQDWLNKDARKLSIGQQQRVCLARAVLGPCKALLLDEPTSALDRQTAGLMAKTFRQLSETDGLAIVLVTHDLRIAELCADRVAMMQDGAVIEEGTSESFLNNPGTEAARRFISNETIEKSEESV